MPLLLGDLVRERSKTVPKLPPLSPSDIVKASASFKIATCAQDGIHPRHFGILSDEGLKSLCSILFFAEAIGLMPDCINDLIITRISKAGGGRRTDRPGGRGALRDVAVVTG